jgi:hypothetical protein
MCKPATGKGAANGAHFGDVSTKKCIVASNNMKSQATTTS